MMQACINPPPGSGFVSSMTGWLDCQAQIIGSSGWQALAMPGSTLSTVLAGFLTIFIALIGYQLLLGRTPGVREGTLAFVKIGAVFALATSWPAYRTLVYDLVIDGPAQLVGEIGRPAGIAGTDGSMMQRLDAADQALAQLAILGPGNALVARSDLPPPPFAGFDAFALGSSRILYLLTAIASLASVRVIAGLALALGPFFIAFLLFDNTRSLFEGWVRVLGGAALAAIGVAVGLGLQLGVLEPWLASSLARRAAGEALPTIAVELFVIICLFTIIIVALLFASARLAKAFRLAPWSSRPVVQQPTRASLSPTAREFDRSARQDTERSRAQAMSQAVVSLSRREALVTAASGAEAGPSRIPVTVGNRGPEWRHDAVPIGRSHRRRSSGRTSARAARRDGAA